MDGGPMGMLRPPGGDSGMMRPGGDGRRMGGDRGYDDRMGPKGQGHMGGRDSDSMGPGRPMSRDHPPAYSDAADADSQPHAKPTGGERPPSGSVEAPVRKEKVKLSKETMEKRIASTLDEYVHLKDSKEVGETLTEMGSRECYSHVLFR
jgi:hypothetical protein